ncbi:hypothetical protein DL93DRAFT_132739 [Clavulina sp. PMI_390]|nr:hypothetical protein DL93DRAFT_132739 [Clavulina sp. PMI_390]
MSTLPIPPPIIIENPSGSTATIDAGPSPATATSEATDLPTSTSALCPSDPPIGFTDYLIAQTPELSRYFVKPHVKPDPSSPLQIHRVHLHGQHYRRLPEKLRFREMMKCAHQYYDERKDEPLWPIRMVKLFTGLLVPLAACWWALLWFGSLFRASTTARDSRSPVEIARAWALCLVFVLWTNWKCFGSIPGLFLPSKSPKWINEKAEMQEKGHDVLAKVTKDLEALKQIYRITLAQRRASLASIQERLLADPTVCDGPWLY